MRLALCAVSAIALSGCSWFGGGQSGHSYYKNQKAGYGYSQSGHMQAHGQKRATPYGQQNRCVVYSPAQPVPHGCHPSQVTLATSGTGYGGQSQYTTGGYGSHAGQAAYHGANHQTGPRIKKPKLRGALSMGFEKSNSGAILGADRVQGIAGAPYDPYNPLWVEGMDDGTTTVTYAGEDPYLDVKDISFDDVHSTPFRIAAGGEYIVSPKFTVFGNVGYSYAEGEQAGVSIIGDLTRTDTVNATGVSNSLEYPNVVVSNYNLDFSDMRRLDLEVGARHYFNPVIKDQGVQTLTPFVGVSGGMTHHNAIDAKVSQDHLFMQVAHDSQLADLAYYDVDVPTVSQRVYDAQWVPSAALTAGMEWQLTPKYALALETGLKYEGAREYAIDGENGDSNISIPLTLRGSFNF